MYEMSRFCAILSVSFSFYIMKTIGKYFLYEDTFMYVLFSFPGVS